MKFFKFDQTRSVIKIGNLLLKQIVKDRLIDERLHYFITSF